MRRVCKSSDASSDASCSDAQPRRSREGVHESRQDATTPRGFQRLDTCEKLASSELETKVNAPSIAPSQALMQGILLGIYFHR